MNEMWTSNGQNMLDYISLTDRPVWMGGGGTNWHNNAVDSDLIFSWNNLIMVLFHIADEMSINIIIRNLMEILAKNSQRKKGFSKN